MFIGVACALAACFVWGFIFIIPQFLTGFSSFEIVFGRYLFYSAISWVIFLKQGNGIRQYPLSIWIKAIYFSFASTFFYYTCFVLGLRYADPAICALVLSISPVTIAFYGNWKQKECSYRSLIIPSVLILLGLVIINIPHLRLAHSLSEYGLGLLCCACSLLTWSWYVVANSHFLKKHPEVTSTNWSSLVGVATLFWVVLAIPLIWIFSPENFDSGKYTQLNAPLLNFIVGCLALGVMCSWFGAYLWNKASLYLPVSLAGQLTIFETIFGLIFVYIVAQNWPPFSEWVGITLLLGAVLYGIQTARQAPQHA
ncbi:MAG: EamA family transporter [Parachlamydia sp.]|nr:MAG: EamA family transporter [Parachlamydia sp.]